MAAEQTDPETARADIERDAATADRLAQQMNRRFVLDQEKVDRYLTHNETSDLLIWWVSEPDTHLIGERPRFADFDAKVPSYVRTQYQSRVGRAGRGRLWVAPEFGLNEVPWDDGKATCKAAAHCGGIVFRRNVLAEIAKLPGFVTDLKMDRVKP